MLQSEIEAMATGQQPMSSMINNSMGGPGGGPIRPGSVGPSTAAQVAVAQGTPYFNTGNQMCDYYLLRIGSCQDRSIYMHLVFFCFQPYMCVPFLFNRIANELPVCQHTLYVHANFNIEMLHIRLLFDYKCIFFRNYC